MKKVLLVAIIIALAFSILPTSSVFALNETIEELSIAVDEPLYDLNIFNITKHSSSVDNIFTMVYDRLFSFDNGSLVPDLALSCVIQPSDDIGDCPFEGIEVGCIDWSERPEEWIEAGFIPGMLDVSQINGDFEFLTGCGELVLAITLRSGVYFSDESELTAQDIHNLISVAKQQPQNTLIYKQWEAVAYTSVIDDYTIEFHMNLPANYGYMDFMYSLATPIASIVKLENDEVVGTGAYKITDNVEEYATLALRNDWWKGSLDTSVNVVTFLYYNTSNCLGGLQSGEVALSITNGSIDSVSGSISNGTLKIEKQLAGNPIAVLMNHDDEILSSQAVRRALFWEWNVNLIARSSVYGLVDFSHDFWTYDGHFYPGTKTSESAYVFEAGELMNGNVIDISNKIDLSFIAPSDSFSGEFVEAVVTTLTGNAGHFTIGYQLLSDEEYNSRINEGNYQLALKEIELTEINSAYKYLYEKSTPFMDNLLRAARIAAKIETYQDMHVYIQMERVNNNDLLIVGWKQKSLISDGQIENFKITEKYNPISMVSYIDLRGIDFVTNP